jgi:hypothetical protein
LFWQRDVKGRDPLQGFQKEACDGVHPALVFYVMQHSLNLLVELRLVRGVLIAYPLVVAKQALLLSLRWSWGLVEHRLLVNLRLVVLHSRNRVHVVVLEWFKELLARLAFALGTNVRLRNLTYLLFKQLVEVGLEFAIG